MLRPFARVLAMTVSVASAMGAQSADTGAPAEPTLVLAELFTSEGCSSCPAADHLLETLLKEQPISGVHVVALSEHVTYCDHQGWKDPFGSEQFTNRQKAYGFGFSLDSIYTPQLVVDGVTEAVGSDERNIRRLLVDAAKTPKPRLTVEASVTEGALAVSASGPGLATTASKDAELWWAVTEDNLVVDVMRGENASRTLRHSGVVRLLRSVKHDKATAQTSAMLPGAWQHRDRLRVVAFVQSSKSRRVLSMGFSPVR